MPLAGELIRASDIGGDVGCRLRRVANQSINNITDTAISWDTEDQDTDGFIAVTSATITIPTGLGGLYAITAFAAAAANLAGRCYIDIVPTTTITGTPANLRVTIPTVASDSRYLNALTIPLNAADTFQVHVFHTIGAATNHTAWLSCYRIASF
jgi:hypothetical protein